MVEEQQAVEVVAMPEVNIQFVILHDFSDFILISHRNGKWIQ